MKKWHEPKLYMLSVTHTHTDLETPIFDTTPVFDSSPIFDDSPIITTSSGIQITTGSSITVDTDSYESNISTS